MCNLLSSLLDFPEIRCVLVCLHINSVNIKIIVTVVTIRSFRTYPFTKPSCKSSSGSSHRSVNSYSFDYSVSVLAPQCSLAPFRASAFTIASFSLDSMLAQCILLTDVLDRHLLLFGSLFKGFLSTCGHS